MSALYAFGLHNQSYFNAGARKSIFRLAFAFKSSEMVDIPLKSYSNNKCIGIVNK